MSEARVVYQRGPEVRQGHQKPASPPRRSNGQAQRDSHGKARWEPDCRAFNARLGGLTRGPGQQGGLGKDGHRSSIRPDCTSVHLSPTPGPEHGAHNTDTNRMGRKSVRSDQPTPDRFKWIIRSFNQTMQPVLGKVFLLEILFFHS